MPVFGGKDGIDNVSVVFDRNPPDYTGGEKLTGKVIVLCDNTTPVKGIRVRPNNATGNPRNIAWDFGTDNVCSLISDQPVRPANHLLEEGGRRQYY